MSKKKTGMSFRDKMLVILSCLGRSTGCLLRELLELSLSPTMKNCLFKPSKIDAEMTKVMHTCISVLKNENLIEVYGRTRAKRVKLTGLAIRYLNFSKFEREQTVKRWKGKWYLVIFDIPENKSKLRGRLRSFLYSEGFVQFQKSVFINPCDKLKEVRLKIKELDIEEFVRSLVIEKVDRPKELAAILWNLEELNRGYTNLVEEIGITRCSFGNWTLGQRFLKYWELRKKLIGIMSCDPYLPEPLLPEKWYREVAERRLRKLRFSIL